MKIPLLPHQGGILHRFGTPENQLFIAKISEESIAVKDDAERMVIADSDPSEVASSPAKPRKAAEKGSVL